MEHGPWKKMYFLLNMGIFHGYVSLPEGNLDLPPTRDAIVTTRIITFLGSGIPYYKPSCVTGILGGG